jgi:hypothetical protein
VHEDPLAGGDDLTHELERVLDVVRVVARAVQQRKIEGVDIGATVAAVLPQA